MARKIVTDIQRLALTGSLTMSVTTPVVDKGFVENVTKQANIECIACISPSNSFTVMFRELPPNAMLLNGRSVNVI